jgi:sarcosine oxidase subunit gamma
MRSRVLDPCSIIRIQTWDSEALAPSAVEEPLRIDWPRATGTAASGSADVLCVGPTDWLVVAADPDPTAWLQRLHAAFHDSPFCITNVSQALIRIQIEGPEVRYLLAKGCSIDLHPPLFPPGLSARTRFAGMPVIVRCVHHSTFECIVSRSFTDYFLSWSEDAALEFGGYLLMGKR